VRGLGTTKLYNILFTKELHRRYHDQGVSAAAFHPGLVATNIAAGSRGWWRHLYGVGSGLLAAPEKGAAQLVWLAQSEPNQDWQSGTYYEKGKPAKKNNPQALDAALATELWDRSEALLDRETS
jgi:NAD(P)-dependent dehydrogenase (short-subunit alcohol dehydrogenase family)